MTAARNCWALVLAAGDGTRLKSLTTTPSGAMVPKQFCSLRDGPSLLQEALNRAATLTSAEHTCVIVAEQHRRWWEPALPSLPASNIIVQPENRGTAIGILLPLLHIVERDPGAHVVLMPSDHHVHDEAVLASAVCRATQELRRRSSEAILLGLQPEAADPELGYILPRRKTDGALSEVGCFVEKPSEAAAQELIEKGGLWNAFIVASSAAAMLELFRGRFAEIAGAMRIAVRHDLRLDADGHATATLYDRLPVVDFSRDVLQGQEARLRVLRVPPCGWSDLGTPARVERALRRVAPRTHGGEPQIRGALLSLAMQHERLHGPQPIVQASAA